MKKKHTIEAKLKDKIKAREEKRKFNDEKSRIEQEIKVVDERMTIEEPKQGKNGELLLYLGGSCSILLFQH